MATHSRILAWKIPWTEEPRRLQSMGSPRVRHDWMTKHACTVLHRVQYFYFKPRMSRSKGKSSSDTAGIAKHTHTHTHQEIKMETKVKIIERVKKDGRCHSTIYMNYPTISMSLKNRTRSWTYEVSCADDVNNNIKAYKSDGRNGETFQCVDTGSASALSPAQLNADSRES